MNKWFSPKEHLPTENSGKRLLVVAKGYSPMLGTTIDYEVFDAYFEDGYFYLSVDCNAGFEVVCWTEIEQPTEFFNVDEYGDLIPR